MSTLIRKGLNSLTVDQENIFTDQIKNVGKDILASGRKHHMPKQAFGEIKNVLHQQQLATPLKGQVSKLSYTTPMKMISGKKDENKTAIGTKKKEYKYSETKANNWLEDDLEYIWAKNSVLTDEDLDRIVNGNAPDEIETQTIFKPSFDELIDFNDFDSSLKNIEPPKFKFDVLNLPKDDWCDNFLDF